MSTDRYRVLCADLDPLTYGGTYYRGNLTDGYDVFEVQPVAAYVGGAEAAEVGFPFWSRESFHDRADIVATLSDRHVLGYIGADRLLGRDVDTLIETEILEVVYALHSYGCNADNGPAGWSGDLPLSGLGITEEDGAAADDAFRADVLGEYDDDTDGEG